MATIANRITQAQLDFSSVTAQPLHLLQALQAPVVQAPEQPLVEGAQAVLRGMNMGSAGLQQGWQAMARGSNDETPLSSLSDAQLQRKFGTQASDLQTLGEMTVGQASNLLSNGGVMDSVKELLAARSDLKVGDVTTKNGTRLLPILQDSETRQLLTQRKNLMPKDLEEMKGQIMSAVKDPAMAQMAFKQASQILGQRDDLKPQELGRLFGDIMGATGKNPDSKATGLSMFGQAAEMLKSGKSVEDIRHLLDAASHIGGGGGPNQATGVANAFQMAAETAGQRPDMKPEEIAKMARVTSERFPGKDNQDRLRAFQEGTRLMGSSASVDHKTVDTMLARGAEQGLRGEKLLRSFETQGDALKSGAVSVHTMSDRGTQGLEFGRDGRLVQGKPGQSPLRSPLAGKPGEKPGDAQGGDKAGGRSSVALRPPTGRAAFAVAFQPGGLRDSGPRG